MKNKYKLILLRPSMPSHSLLDEIKIIEGDYFEIKGGAYVFKREGGLIICCYPVQYTIINSIEKI
jgi:hypothetical protein